MTETAAPLELSDYLHQLRVGVENGALKSRRTGYHSRCSACGEQVETVEDQIQILTSSGKAPTWRRRPAWAHREECMQHIEDAFRNAPPIELWPERPVI